MQDALWDASSPGVSLLSLTSVDGPYAMSCQEQQGVLLPQLGCGDWPGVEPEPHPLAHRRAHAASHHGERDMFPCRAVA